MSLKEMGRQTWPQKSNSPRAIWMGQQGRVLHATSPKEELELQAIQGGRKEMWPKPIL